jgi:endonuclease/exonuclease/phosphatase family metal-dependent hydrolase
MRGPEGDSGPDDDVTNIISTPTFSISAGRLPGHPRIVRQTPPSTAEQGILPVRISTWNTNGFFGQPVSPDAAHRLRSRRRILAALTATSDIICLQEVHGSVADLAELRSLHPLWSACGSFCSSRAAGGVVIMYSKKIASAFTSIVDLPVVQGWIHRVALDGPCGSLNIICVHSNPRLADALRLAEFRKISKCIGESASTTSMVVGDFNAPAPAEERFDMLLQKWTTSDQRLAVAIEATIDKMTEVLQPDFTRVGMEGGAHRFFSRIDRLFTDMPTIDILDSQPYGRTTCDPAAKNFPSDHCPVTFVFRRLNVGPPDRVSLPSWLTKMPQFALELNKFLAHFIPDYDDPLSSHDELKEMIHMAAAATRLAIANVEPDSAERMVYIAMRAARAIRRQDTKGMQKVLNCYQAIRDIFGQVAANDYSGEQVARLHALLQSVSVQALEEEVRKLSMSKEEHTPDRDSKRAKIDVRLRLWRSHSRKAAFSAVRAEDGSCHTSLPEMSRTLHSHWQGVFNEKQICRVDAEILVARLRSPDLDALVIPDSTIVAEYMETLGDSSPGPDGIPYSAWKATGLVGASSIRGVLLHVLAGGCFPIDASTSLMVFFSKLGSGCLVAKADEMRPISLTNTDAKLWASLINYGLSRALEKCIDPVQKGFVRGRRGSDHVIHLDARAYALSLQRHDPAVILADIRAAFPSLSHEFIKIVLFRMLGSHPFLRAILLLYKDMVAVIVLAGMFLDRLAVKSGLRQGCPLSGTIFAICFQAWTAHVELQSAALTRGGTMWLFAFADDIAFAIASLWESLGFLAAMFELLASATCLVMNAKKTILMPLWRNAILAAVAARATATSEVWKGTIVALTGKYLGVQVGPSGHELNVSSQTREYKLRCRTISLLGGGWSQALHLHNMVAFPVLSYILQFYKAPTCLAPIVMPVIATLLGTPNMAISAAAVRSFLQLSGKSAGGFPSMALVSQATLARVWLQLENAEAIYSELQCITNSDDSFVRPQHPGWKSVVFINTLHDNFAALAISLPDPCPPKGMQSRIHRLLRMRAAEEPLMHFVARRLGTVFRHNPACMQFTAKFAIANLALAAKMLPLVHLAGYIRLLCNAVITSARMGRVIDNCFFCNHPSGDDVRHWGCCTGVETIAGRLLPRLGFTTCSVDPLDSILGAFPASNLRSVGFVILADLLVFAHAHMRHGDASGAVDLARTRLRMLATNLPKVAACIESLSI